MQLSLEPNGRCLVNGEQLAVYSFEVLGLPEGHGAWIHNLDYPRALWSIQRFRDGKQVGTPTGGFYNAGDALDSLRTEYE